MEYSVEITEVLQRSVKILADNEADAIRKIKFAYNQSKIVLDENDFIGTRFDVVK